MKIDIKNTTPEIEELRKLLHVKIEKYGLNSKEAKDVHDKINILINEELVKQYNYRN